MLGREWERAEWCFEETRRIAERLGEKWTSYGAMANSACLLMHKGDGLDKALELADKAMGMARQNKDRKGIGDAGLLAGLARLRLLQDGTRDGTLLRETDRILGEAHDAFVGLGQRLGQVMARWGRMELARMAPGDGDILVSEDPEPCLSGTSYAALTPALLPLPWHMFLLMEVF